MISFIETSVVYSDRHVIDRLSLEISSGERIALTAPSGSGKTTLLNLIAGIIRTSSGLVKVSGSVSYVFQEPRLLPWCSCLENLNIVMGDSSKTLGAAGQMLERLGLEAAEKKYPHELSGGMQQRLSIGRALCYDGDILLLDEPLKGLDSALRDSVAELINERTAGKTVVLATHDKAEIDAFAKQIYTYADGKFIREASD